jgi:hypothetical protein
MLLTGQCHCGNVRATASLSLDPVTVAPRRCDCSFCERHGAAYVSDSAGTLQFTLAQGGEVARYRQGAELAEMLVCRRCGVLVGALYDSGAGVYGVLNVRALDQQARFAPPETASPQRLTPTQKAERWKRLWFAQVTIDTKNP